MMAANIIASIRANRAMTITYSFNMVLRTSRLTPVVSIATGVPSAFLIIASAPYSSPKSLFSTLYSGSIIFSILS